jgi:two-component system, LuxR family, response regulator FixJ
MADEATIFVVDDDQGCRDSLAALLRASGMRVQTYSSAQAFLEAYEPSRLGCLLLDVRMPGISGLDLQERLAARGAKLPIILMTAYGDVPTAVKAMQAGAINFIEKPIREEALLESLRRALQQGERLHKEREYVGRVRALIDRLTPREREVLRMLVAGKANKVIAAELGISERTVEIHRQRVRKKLEARSLSQMVRMALVAGSAG